MPSIESILSKYDPSTSAEEPQSAESTPPTVTGGIDSILSKYESTQPVSQEKPQLHTPNPLVATAKSTAASMANAFAGQPLEDIGETIGSESLQNVGKGVREYAESVQKENPSQISSLSDIVDKPLTAVETALGNIAPQIPVSLAGGYAGAKAGAALPLPPQGKAVAAGLGGILGAFAPNYLQEAAEMRGKQHESGTEDKTKAYLTAIPAAGLETASDVLLAGKFLPKAVKDTAIGKALGSIGEDTLSATGSRAAHIGKQALKGAGTEAGTEYAQTILEQLGGNQDTSTEEAQAEREVSAALGAIGGGAVGGGVSAFDKRAGKLPSPVAEEQVLPQEPEFAEVPDTEEREPIIAGTPSDLNLRTDEEKAAERQDRFNDLSARFYGTSDTDTVFEGKQITIPGRPKEFLSPEEKAELSELEKEFGTPIDLSTPAAPVVDTKQTEDFLNRFENAWATTGKEPTRVTKALADEATKLGVPVTPNDAPMAIVAAMRAEIEARKSPEEVAQDVGDSIVAETLAAYPDGKPGIAGKTVIAGASSKVLDPQKVAAEQKVAEQQPFVEDIPVDEVVDLPEFEGQWDEYDDSIPYASGDPIVPLTAEDLQKQRMLREAALAEQLHPEEEEPDADSQAYLQARYEENKAKQEAQDALKKQEAVSLDGGSIPLAGTGETNGDFASDSAGLPPEGQESRGIQRAEEKAVATLAKQFTNQTPTTQKRAAVGGEIGPNGEFYKGGAFIATTDLPKKIKQKLQKYTTGSEQFDIGVGKNTLAVPEPGKMPIVRAGFLGTAVNPHTGELNDTFIRYNKFTDAEIAQIKELRDKWLAGEKYVNVADYPNLANVKDAARLAANGLPIPEELLLKLPLDIQENIRKFAAKPLEPQTPEVEDGKSEDQTAQTATQEITPEYALREIGRLSDEAMGGNHPAMPQQSLANGDFAGSGKLNMDGDGNVVLTRVASSEDHLSKDWQDISGEELINTSLSHGGGRGIPTSGIASWGKSYGATHGGDRVIGTFKIPLQDLLSAIQNGNAILGNIGEGEIVLNPAFAESYLASVTDTEGNPVARKSDGISLPTDITGRAETTTQTTAPKVDPALEEYRNPVDGWETYSHSLKGANTPVEPVTGVTYKVARVIADKANKRKDGYEYRIVAHPQFDTYKVERKAVTPQSGVAGQIPWKQQKEATFGADRVELDNAPVETKNAKQGESFDERVERVKKEQLAMLDRLRKEAEEPVKPLSDQIAEAAYARNPKGEQSTPGTVSHHDIAGIPVNIETPAETTRQSKDGAYPPRKMTSHYGNISKVKGKDGDQLDVFVNPKASDDQLTNPKSVFVIDQIDPATGKYDETKIMLGYDSEAQAREKYLENFDSGWQGLGAITEMPFDEFKARIDSGENWDAPVAYKEPAAEKSAYQRTKDKGEHPWQMTSSEYATFLDKGKNAIPLEDRINARLKGKPIPEGKEGENYLKNVLIPEATRLEAILESERLGIKQTLLSGHKFQVESAVDRGEAVPDKVLAEYPDLRAKDKWYDLKDADAKALVSSLGHNWADAFGVDGYKRPWERLSGTIKDSLAEQYSKPEPPKAKKEKVSPLEKAKKALSATKSKIPGFEDKSKAEAVELAVKAEKKFATVEVDDKAAQTKDYNLQKKIANAIAVLASETYLPYRVQQEMEELYKKVDSGEFAAIQHKLLHGKYTKPEYRVYQGRDTEGGYNVISKGEYEYAKLLEAAEKPVGEAETKEELIPPAPIEQPENKDLAVVKAKFADSVQKAYEEGELEIPQYMIALDILASDDPTVLQDIQRFVDKAFPSYGELQRVKAKGSVNMKRLLSLVGSSMYKANLADTSIKEMVQNSFDAVKAQVSKNKGLRGKGNIDILVDHSNRLIAIRDNGKGMSKSTILNAFLTVAGSNKEDLEGGLASGGFGMAKAAFLYGNERIYLRTVHNGKLSILEASGDELLSEKGGAEIEITDTDEPNGTTLIVKVPENVTIDGESRYVYFPYGYEGIDFLRKPLLNDDVAINYRDGYIDTKAFMDPTPSSGEDFDSSMIGANVVPTGRNMDLSGYDKNTTANFDWGFADIYIGKKRNKYPKHQILSAGVYQFDDSFNLRGWEKIPYDLIINVKPTVDADSASYPFNLKREGWKDLVEKDIGALKKYVSQVAMGIEAQETVDVFKNIKSLPKIEVANIGKSTGFDVSDFIPKKEVPTASTGTTAFVPPSVTVSVGKVTGVDSKGEIVTYVDVEKEKQKEKGGESSFSTEKEAPKASDFLADFGIDASAPVYVNNTSYDYVETDPNIAVFFAELGNIMMQVKAKVSNMDMYGYKKLKDTDTFMGISIDKQYHGVHVNVPFHGIFLNPLAVKGTKLPGITQGLWETIVHEFTHIPEGNHDVGFVTEYHELSAKLASDGFDIQMRVLLGRVLNKHKASFLAAREQYESSTTKNIAKSLHEGEDGTGVASATAQARPERGADKPTADTDGDVQGGREAASRARFSRNAGIRGAGATDLAPLFESLGRVNKLSQLSDDQLQRIDEHPDAERIRYVQDNFLDLLSELDTNNKVTIKC